MMSRYIGFSTSKGPKHSTGLMGPGPSFLVCCFFVFFASVANGQGYDFERAPKKLALVIGNESYKNLAPLASSRSDAQTMAQRLTELGFEVDLHLDVPTVDNFQNEIFKEFRKRIDVGDFVIFYFSGHGFSYGSNNFLAPTDIPLSIPEGRVTSYGISIDAFETLLASHSPGLMMFFIDACRSVGGFVIRNEQGNNVVGKGSSPQRDNKVGVNSLICYATRPGEIASGFTEPGRLSIFTQALVDYIGLEGQPFHDVFSKVASDVRASTNSAQVPGTYDWSQTDPYLNPTVKNLQDQREVWRSMLDKPTLKNIQMFCYRYSVSLHAAACRQWLTDHLYGAETNSFTVASPLAIDRAWRPANEVRLSVRGLAIPFAFTRSVEVGLEPELRTFSDTDIGLVRAGTSAKKIAEIKTGELYFANAFNWSQLPADFYRNSLAFSLANIDAHGTVVATRDLLGRLEPNLSAKVVERVLAGTQVKIDGVIPGVDRSIWVSASISGRTAPFFLKVEPGTTPPPLELGKSLKEIIVLPRSDSIPELVNPETIRKTVAELREQGWKIKWVSLSVGSTADHWEQATREARMANAEYILKLTGVDGSRITSVSGTEDLKGNGVRVRFFGVK